MSCDEDDNVPIETKIPLQNTTERNFFLSSDLTTISVYLKH